MMENEFADEQEVNLADYELSEEVGEIITAVPPAILRWGITLIFLIFIIITGISALISYPDIVKSPLKVNALNAAKEVLTHQQGKLVKLLVKDGSSVQEKQALAFIESTAKHEDVLLLGRELAALSRMLNKGTETANLKHIFSENLQLGELQDVYQNFHQEYIQFLNTQAGGFYLQQKVFLQKDLDEINKLQQQILRQKQIQEKEYANIAEDYERYKQLWNKNVISNSEFKQQENKFLAGKYPLEQSATALINNRSTYLSKQKELVTLENAIYEQQNKFMQALGSMQSQLDKWLQDYVVSANMDGKLSYVGILQEKQFVKTGQELFLINPGDHDFFGEVQIPQYNMGKVNLGQKVLVKLRSYPFEEYGAINGEITYLSDAALKDSVFFAKIDFRQLPKTDRKPPIILKQGMMADAEIITQESSLLQRFLRNMVKVFN